MFVALSQFYNEREREREEQVEKHFEKVCIVGAFKVTVDKVDAERVVTAVKVISAIKKITEK